MISKYHADTRYTTIFGALRPSLRLFLLIGLAVSCTQPAAAQLETRPLVHHGYSRPYLIFRPSHPAAHPAVVVMLGGIRSTAKYEAANFGWMEEAESNGFLAVFPEPVATKPEAPADGKNIAFWEMKGSRTHLLLPGMPRVDDEGYLLAVLHDVARRDRPDRRRIFMAGFSSGSGMVQLLASRYPKEISAIVAVATPLMDPTSRLARPVPILYIHGDDDEQFSGFEVNSPRFATTPHGNWVTWGFLDGCHTQTAEKTEWGVHFAWLGCKNDSPVIADFIEHFGHEWAGSLDAHWDRKYWPSDPPNFTRMAWQFFAGIHSK